ncbi:MAG: polysaccharide biosynthesis/export family protein [Phycisphaeraceae bacterium]|nr:polysaccharide biosynthesis/export family protein [Phycisphaeraceae bacterium]
MDCQKIVFTRNSRLPLCLLGAVGLALGGCNADSYMDPSKIGRWEMTPTTVPILRHLAVIEDAAQSEVEYSDIEPEDLIPEVEDYRIAAGDAMEVTIYGLTRLGVPDAFQRPVDARGNVDLPQIGPVSVSGLTRDEAEEAIKRAAAPIVTDAVVSVVMLSQREATFSLMGSVQNPGTFLIPAPNYRLLDALAIGGAFNEEVDYIFVIRQVQLTDEGGSGRSTLPPADESTTPTTPPASGDDLLHIIDDLSQPTPVPPGGGSPGAFQPTGAVISRDATQPGREPVVPLVDQPDRRPPRLEGGDQPEDGAQWMYLNGQWVQVRKRPTQGAGDDVDNSPVVTQRVIRVPIRPLVEGDARYNVVIRPGDLVRVPRPAVGNIFLSGEIARPGTFQLAPKLTLTNAIAAAGGLGGLAIPERVDLIRMIGDDRKAIVRLNLRAIEEGTQPDIFLKPNDRINVGTNFWALPLAVVRSGFRASYGFGFLLDRNFGNDVFGAPPVNRQF